MTSLSADALPGGAACATPSPDMTRGVVNGVTGTGPASGEPLARHAVVSAIEIERSLSTGRQIASMAAPQMKKLHLELGGKDPMTCTGTSAPKRRATGTPTTERRNRTRGGPSAGPSGFSADLSAALVGSARDQNAEFEKHASSNSC